ncbi:MAG: response regulator [bacterium]
MRTAKILLLDDDERVRFNLKIFLEDEGFECHECESAENAFKIIENYLFDIAIVDIRLPGKTGEEFILEAYGKSQSTKYIIYTGSADYRLPQELKKIGMAPADVLHKPVENMYTFVEIINAKLKS